MERWLNSRGALVAAWSVVGVMLLAAAGFALYLMLPAVRDAGSGDRDPALTEVAVTTVAGATRPGGRTQFIATVDKIEGQALVVKVSGSEPLRVLVRSGAPVGRLGDAQVSDIRSGEQAVVTFTTQSDGRAMGTRVRLQPTTVPVATAFGEPRPGGSTLSFQAIAGTVMSIEGGHLRLDTPDGERAIDLAPSVRVTRFIPVSLSEVHPGQRVSIVGEYLIDGSLAALSIQVFGQ